MNGTLHTGPKRPRHLDVWLRRPRAMSLPAGPQMTIAASACACHLVILPPIVPSSDLRCAYFNAPEDAAQENNRHLVRTAAPSDDVSGQFVDAGSIFAIKTRLQ